MRRDRTPFLTRTADRLAGWSRFAVIFTVIVANGIFEETLILRAECMMLLRWTRDLLRYGLRWTVQEKLRLLMTRRPGSTRD
jgi:hypothetical protein